MSILFDNNLSQYLKYAAPVDATPPFSMGCWFYCDDLTLDQDLVCQASEQSTWAFHTLELRGGDAGDYLRAWTNPGGYAASTVGYSANTWQHALGVWAAVDDRRVYLAGGNKGTNSSSGAPENIENTMIGAISVWSGAAVWTGAYLSGRQAEAAIWNATLDDVDALLLAAGVRPYMVKPGNLVAYWPMHVAAMLKDLIGSYDMTAYNSPTTAEHPPILTLGGPLYVEYEVAAPPVGNPAHMMHYARMRRA